MSPLQHKLLSWVTDIAPKFSSSSVPVVESSRRRSVNRNRLSLLSFGRSSKCEPRPPRLSSDILPAELWLRILRYALRLTGAQAVDPKDPFEPEDLQEDYPNIHPGYFEDRRACRRVCRLFDLLVTEIMMEYIVMHTQGELERTVKVLETDTFTDKLKRLGDWTTRIDFCISGKYDPDWVLRLLAVTPNLLIFTMNTGRAAEFPEHPMNKTILRGLVDFHGKNLKRLEWVGMNDAPTYADLHLVAKNIRGLITLSMKHLFSLPSTNVSQPMLVFPSLKSLSLGYISQKPPPGLGENQFPLIWDPFLMYLMGRPFQLSELEHFEVDICPISDFFAMYGHKIRTFSTSSWSFQDCINDAFGRLTNLKTFHYVYHTVPECHLPLYHPTLQRVAIIPRIENYVEVPKHTYQCCIIKPLDDLLANVEDMNAKKLVEVRICDRGAFTGIFESDDCLFWHWRRRFREYKGITLQNKFGDLNARYAKYGKNPPKLDSLYSIHTDRPAPGTTSIPTNTLNSVANVTAQSDNQVPAPNTQASNSLALPSQSSSNALSSSLSQPQT